MKGDTPVREAAHDLPASDLALRTAYQSWAHFLLYAPGETSFACTAEAVEARCASATGLVLLADLLATLFDLRAAPVGVETDGRYCLCVPRVPEAA